jgi:GNAT superfamily N-acetyltransferase
LTIEENPRSRDVQNLIEATYQYNRIKTQTKIKEVKRLAIFLRDSRNHVAGGILGWVYWDWLQIEFLWVKDDLRGMGYGKDLMFAAEERALAMGCHQAYLETFSFQAPDFY